MVALKDDQNNGFDADLWDEVLATVEDRVLEIEDLVDVSRDAVMQAQAMAELKRVIHSLKGLCQAYGLSNISNACHSMEDRLENWDEIPQPELRIFVTRLQQMFEEHLKE